MKRRNRKIVLISLCFILSFTLAGCQQQPQKNSSAAVPTKESSAKTETVKTSEDTTLKTEDTVSSAKEETDVDAKKEENITSQKQQASEATSKTVSKAPDTVPKPSVKAPSQKETGAASVAKQSNTVSVQKKENSTSSTKTQEVKNIVSLCIIGADGHTVLSKQDVAWNEGDTVIDVLLRETKNRKIQMEYSGGKKMAYVDGIDNLYEFDLGEGSGWMYSVNGVYPKESCGAYTLKKGDSIAWRYTKNLGEDLGAKRK